MQLDISPVPASRPRVTRRGITFYAEPYKSYKKDLKQLIEKVWDGDVISDRLSLSIRCVVDRPKKTSLFAPRPDVDNYAKAVMDAMNGVVFEDDRQVTFLCVSKEWASPGQPGFIQISIKT